MTHYNPKGRTISPHCAPPGLDITFRGETQMMNNQSSRCNRSLAKCRLPCDGRVISLAWFPETYSRRCPLNHCNVQFDAYVRVFLLLGWTLCKPLGTLFNTGEGVPALPSTKIYQKPWPELNGHGPVTLFSTVKAKYERNAAHFHGCEPLWPSGKALGCKQKDCCLFKELRFTDVVQL